jgi:hypothetical protein
MVQETTSCRLLRIGFLFCDRDRPEPATEIGAAVQARKQVRV